MSDLNNNSPLEVGLTATEVSNIWSSYLKSTMELKFFEYFYACTEDNEIKNIIEKMVNQSQASINDLKEIFIKENLTIPIGFTEKDITVGAHKVFSDTFMLYFCLDITLLSMSTYPSALSDCSRKDVRNYFQVNIEFFINMQNDIIDLMLSKGVYLKPPQVAIDNELEFVGSKRYLSKLLSGSRPLNVAEIANLTRLIHRAQFSKMIFVAFSKLAIEKDVKQHFSKGRNEMEKVLDLLRDILEKENISSSASGDYEIFDVEMSPFSDKLMLYFVNTCLGMYCFTLICQGMSSTFRSDIIFELTSISNRMRKFYGGGLLLTINEKWFEEPPQAVDRKV